MENRICKDCSAELPISEFYKNGKFYKTSCKSCDRKRSANYKLNNLEKVRENYREYGRKNKRKREQYNIDYYKLNRDEILVKQKKYWSEQENKERKALRKREQWQIDENLRISSNCRGRIYKALKGQKKSKSTEKLVGCLFSELKTYLELKFLEGMNWNNYGEWHIDHILPCASFDLSKKEEQEKCFHYTNLQPLWGTDNLIKSSKIL
ncbi:MAG: hypothetical protein KBG30_12270 [Bacteroidales bacterium]|nr:hypothetical protein [Bacteroidales bacterium]